MKYLSEILYLLGNNKRKLPLMLFLFLFLSFLDLIGIGLIGPYVALVANENLVTEGYFYDFIVLFNLPLDRQELLSSTGFILIFLFLFKSILAIFINRHIIQFSNNQKSYLQEFLMRSYQDMEYSHYIGRNSSEYIQSIQGYVDNYRGVLLTGLRTVSDSLVAVVILLMLVMINPISVLILTLLIGISGFSYDSFFRNKVPIYGRRVNEAKTKIIRGTYEGIKGFKEIKIIGKEGYFYNLVSEGAISQSQNDTKSQVITTAPKYLLELIMVSFVVFMVFSSSSWIGIEQDDILPVLSMFGIAALRLIPSANTILSSVVQFRINRHAISKLYLDLKELKKHQINNISNKLPNASKFDTFNKFSINDVCYSYPGQKNMALNKINIKINKGDTIGIIGTSGSGKTTLIDVILGLLKPQSGQVKYNDNDIFKSLKDWQSQIAYLPQQVFLIDGTLRNNVALGADDKDIDDMQMRLSIEKSRLSKLIQSLPDGMDTNIGEDGIRLSGGQRQRVALARAFYHKREILIMDESTSALDSESEQEIIRELKVLKRDKTIIIIAHSLSLIKDCDYIYKLGNGKIIDHGKYGEIF